MDDFLSMSPNFSDFSHGENQNKKTISLLIKNILSFSARKLLVIDTGCVRLNELNREAERRPCGTIKAGDGSIWNPLEQQLTACVIVTDLKLFLHAKHCPDIFSPLICPHKHCRTWVLVLLPSSSQN